MQGTEAEVFTTPCLIAELCCVLEIAGSQHYPPSWVEASILLELVVIGSATPVGASQWSFCRTGSRTLCPAPGDFFLLEADKSSLPHR